MSLNVNVKRVLTRLFFGRYDTDIKILQNVAPLKFKNCTLLEKLFGVGRDSGHIRV